MTDLPDNPDNAVDGAVDEIVEEIPEIAIPLTDLPEGITIAEDPVPLVDSVEIGEDPVPLSDVPQTGDNATPAVFGVTALLALLGLKKLRKNV